jgi:hypothetical protein
MFIRDVSKRLPRNLSGIVTALPTIAVFVAVFCSKLWLIREFGNDVPFWDQWDGEGTNVYKPLLEGGFGSVDWFLPHNEHRIVLGRLTSALLLYMNSQWDPLVEMCWEAFCSAAIATTLCVVASRLFSDERSIVLVRVLAVLGTALPYGWENSLWGFESQFYYLILVALLLFYACSTSVVATTKSMIVIFLLGLVSLFTLASGALVCFAAAAGLIVKLLFDRLENLRRLGGLVITLVVLGLFAIAITPTLARHDTLRSHDLAEAVGAFYWVLSWPTRYGFLLWAPFLLWALRRIWTRRMPTPGIFVTALAAFLILNAAAIATTRASGIAALAVASRYTDIIWFNCVVNLLAAIMLNLECRPGVRRVGLQLLLLIYFIAICACLIDAGQVAFGGAINRGETYALEAENVRSYVLTGNYESLANKAPLQIPFPDPQVLRNALDDPTIRAILPPGIRPGILSRSHLSPQALAHDGLILTGVPYGITPPAPAPYGGFFFGTFGKEGNGNLARFVSPQIRAQGTFIRALVAGYPGRPGLAFYLEDVETGRRVNLVPQQISGNVWQVVQRRIPGSIFRIVAEDAAQGEDGWFAFTDPVEIGRLRPMAEFLTSHGKAWTILAMLLFIASNSYFARSTAPRPEEDHRNRPV